MRKRLLSALVAFCMALTLMPSWALADNDGSAPDPPESGEEITVTDQEPAGDDEQEAGDNDPETPTNPQPSEDDSAEAGEASEDDAAEGDTDADNAGDEEPSKAQNEEKELNVIPADGEEDVHDEPVAVEPEEFDFSDNEDLFLLSGDDLMMAGFYGGYGIQTTGIIGTDDTLNKLDTLQRQIYDQLRPQIEKVGQDKTKNNSTVFSTNITYQTYSSTWTTSAERSSKLGDVISVLQFDLPGHFYWWGKRSLGSSDNGFSNGNLQVTLYVGDEFQANNSNTTLSSAAVSSAMDALDNTSAILSQAAKLPTAYAKLEWYRSEICRLVSYNWDALEEGNYGDNEIQPWQLVWVFDGNDDTKVVCEGYAKAFQYLCDATTDWGEGGPVQCYTVSGDLNGPGGAHMWNIVSIGGANYLVDVTNCDDNLEANKGYGSGYPDRLFLVGATGSVADGYTVNRPSYTFPNGGSLAAGTTTYDYESVYKDSSGQTVKDYLGNLITDKVLELSETNYNRPRTLTGTLTLAANATPATIGTKLTASVTGLPEDAGTVSYTWKDSEDNILQSSNQNQLTIVEALLNTTITVEVTVSGTGYENQVLRTTDKITIPKGTRTVTVPSGTLDNGMIKVTDPVDGQAYAISTRNSGTIDSSDWTVCDGGEVVFGNLTPGTYYIATYQPGDEHYNDSAIAWSASTIVIKGTPTIDDLTVTMDEGPLVYDGTSKNPAHVTAKTPGLGAITVTYQNALGDTVAPTNSGIMYYPVVHIAASAQFDEVTLRLADYGFSIQKGHAELIISGTNSVKKGGNTLALTLTGVPADLEAGVNVLWAITSGATIAGSNGGATVTSGSDAGTVTVTATLPESNNYREAVSDPFEITITDKDAQTLTFAQTSMTAEFGDSVPANTLTHEGDGEVTYSVEPEGIVTVNESTGAITGILTVGTVTVKATAAETASYAETTASYTLEITQKDLAAEDLAVTLDGTPVQFTGSAIEPGVASVVWTNPSNPSDTITLTEDDYDVTYGENINVEDSGTVIITLKGNYSGTKTESFAITKGETRSKTLEASHRYTLSGAQTLALPLDDCGTASAYAVSAFVDSESILTAQPTAANGELSYTLADNSEKTIPESGSLDATLTVTITGSNYDLVYAVTIKVVDKATQDWTPGTPTLKFTQNGYTDFTVEIVPNQSDAKPSGFDYEYSFDGGSSWQSTPGKSGTVTVGTVISAAIRLKETDDYMPGASAAASAPAPLLKSPTPTVTSSNGTAFTSSTSVTLSCDDQIDGFDVPIFWTDDPTSATWNQYDGTPIVLTSTKTLYVWTDAREIEDAGFTRAAEFDESETVTITFTKRNINTRPLPSGGGSSSSSDKEGITGTVTNNGGAGGTTSTTTPSTPSTPSTPGISSGSTTTTAAPSATVKDGTASATVNGSTGKDLVDEAVSNDSDVIVIAPGVSGSVDKTDVTIGSSVIDDISGRTDADLRVETPAADVTIPNRGLSNLAGKGGSVVVSTSVKGNAIDVTITAGGSKIDRVTGGVKVEIPTDCTPGTVAMVTLTDGTTQLVRKSMAYASAGVVSVPLDGSATITLMDNSKSFGDVPAGNTFANAVAFVSSREIMSGTGANTFNPSAPLTRAQLAKILHNLENNPSAAVTGSFSDVASDFWSAEAIQWASDMGIVTGYTDGTFKPNSYITREQLAVMLYRYAGSPNIRSSELRFTDASAVGSYAQAAMIWATQNGVMNGNGGMLNPKGQATRAQAAQMLLNYMSNIG